MSDLYVQTTNEELLHPFLTYLKSFPVNPGTSLPVLERKDAHPCHIMRRARIVYGHENPIMDNHDGIESQLRCLPAFLQQGHREFAVARCLIDCSMVRRVSSAYQSCTSHAIAHS